MSLRKGAGLLAVFGLIVGTLGSGVGAAFLDQVTAQENIAVGTFECLIVQPSDGVVAGDGKSVTYTAPKIMSSAPDSAPFSFTVQNTGEIPAVLKVSTSAVSAPFSIIGSPFADVPLASLATHTFNTGVQWGELSSSDEGASGTVTWTIDCVEAPATQEVRSATLNYSGGGWGGWSCPSGASIVSAAVEAAPGGTSGNGAVASLTLWKPGASVAGFTYPSTPFGYTYGAGEEGAIAQNDGDSDQLVIVLQCTVP